MFTLPFGHLWSAHVPLEKDVLVEVLKQQMDRSAHLGRGVLHHELIALPRTASHD